MNGKNLALYCGVIFVLLSSAAFAISAEKTDISDQNLSKVQQTSFALGAEEKKDDYHQVVYGEIHQPALQLSDPDLTVISARVMSAPIISYASETVSIPLEITIKNQGDIGVAAFNVGGFGASKDGNVQGFEFIVPGETVHDSGGVYVNGLSAGAEKIFRGFLVLIPQPVGRNMNPGSRYEIQVMVDYNLDPDAGYYDWGYSEDNETNNCLMIFYPTQRNRPPVWCSLA